MMYGENVQYVKHESSVFDKKSENPSTRLSTLIAAIELFSLTFTSGQKKQ